ncbi:unnamed protein product [Ambrosiozyma monospora]|uniref:Unnamed protein product n=1 Tax=Ambrosiozyma monospora TaxID=43982 RepID=A0ACB5T6Y5_AMBMO|nr:unnamed protein product [Ambrosiozyma monospora]
MKMERFKLNLKVELAHKTRRLSLKDSMYLISIEDGTTTSTANANNANSPADEAVKALNDKVRSAVMPYFRGLKTIPGIKEEVQSHSNGVQQSQLPRKSQQQPQRKVVPLRTAIACDYLSVERVVDELHAIVKKALFQ